MKDYTVLTMSDFTVGTPIRRLGVNVEVQDHCERANLYDWLCESGAQVIRSFHPERQLRAWEQADAEWYPQRDHTAFMAWRANVLADPEGAHIRWDDFRFDTAVPWVGVPDAFCQRYRDHGLPILGSLGYAPKMYPEPLVVAVGSEAEPEDDGINWAAAACAYEYYFAVIYHFVKQGTITDFLMINEPENRFGQWYLSDDLVDETWESLFWEDQGDIGSKYLRQVGAQYAVLCRLARMAMDDVAVALERDDVRLIGPTTVTWDVLWDMAHAYLDAVDWHHYHPDERAFSASYAATAAQAHGKPVMITEFNRYSGGMKLIDSNLVSETAEQTAALLMRLMQLPGPGIDTAALYLFAGPSTHRNHKHLVYGDLDVLDWDGTDRPLWDRGDAWYPTFEELQLRHPTRAFHYFRMLVRHAGGDRAVAVGIHNPTSSGPADAAFEVTTLATQHGNRWLLSVLNPADAAVHAALRLPHGRPAVCARNACQTAGLVRAGG